MDWVYFTGNNEYKLMCLDSGYYYANKALEFEPSHKWAGNLLAKYYDRRGMTQMADNTLKKFNYTGKWEYMKYRDFVGIYNARNDFFRCIHSYFRYKELEPANEPTHSYTYYSVLNAFQNASHIFVQI